MDTLLTLGVWAVLGFLIWAWIKGKKPATQKPAQTPPNRSTQAPAHEWPRLGEFDFEVVGESFYQKAIKKIAGDHGDDPAQIETTALIVPDDQNPHDEKAVRIDIDGMTVGHMIRQDARSFRRRLASKKLGPAITSCHALIVGGYKMKDGTRASYGVQLDIKPFE